MDVKSSISYVEKIWMYKIDLWFYTKYFEYLIYNYENKSNYTFWNNFPEINIEKDLKLQSKVIWVTKFFDYFLVCFFDLKNFSNEYFLVKNTNIFSYNLKNKDYIFIIYTDKSNEEKIFHNCDLEDFEIVYKNKKFEIINKIIDIIVYKREINLKNPPTRAFTDKRYNVLPKGERSSKSSNLLNIIDLYYFDDIFSKNNISILKELMFLNDLDFNEDCRIEIKNIENPFFPNYRIQIFCDINNLESILSYIKLFLSINSEQYLIYWIENEFLNNLLEGLFENISHLKLEEIDLNFELPENIFKYNKNFWKLQKSINKLKYIIYIMKDNLEKINNIWNLNEQNEYVEVASIRLKVQKENLEKLIIVYSERLKQFLEKISSKI